MSDASLLPAKSSSGSSTERLAPGLQNQLSDFRRVVRQRKLLETGLICVTLAVCAYLLVFGLDRLVDTSTLIRGGMLVALLAGLLGFGLWMIRRWVWNTRQLTQIARLLKTAHPRLIDQVLSVVELADAPEEQRRSPQLIAAAMAQVERRAASVNLLEALPKCRWRLLSITMPVIGMAVLLIATLVPRAGWSSLQRLFTPWNDVPRFTFTRWGDMPQQIVVASGEPYSIDVAIDPDSDWKPTWATMYHLSNRISADSSNNSFHFSMPGVFEPTQLAVQAGDASAQIQVTPLVRPEITSLNARIQLPDYLKYENPVAQDARSLSIYALAGSKIEIAGAANRELAWTKLDDAKLKTTGDSFSSQWIDVAESAEFQLDWLDTHGLSGAQPQRLKLRITNDRPPSIACDGLSNQSIWLAKDTLRFDVSAEDDYGLARLGLQWRSIPAQAGPAEKTIDDSVPTESSATVVEGLRTIVSGEPQAKRLRGQATFNCADEKITPQVLELRAFAEDYRGVAGRTYSVPYLIKFMSAAEHADWIAGQLRRWKGKLDGIHDEEMRLLDENRQLRESINDSAKDDTTGKQLNQQSAAERNNADKLESAVNEGKQLLEQALRNEEIRSQQVEQWAKALERLNEIAEQKMPAVADQLQKSADTANSGQPQEASGLNLNKTEQSLDKKDPKEQDSEGQSSESGGSSSSLPETQLQGDNTAKKPENSNSPEDQNTPNENKELDKAVADQTQLLEEFRKARDQFGDLLSELENSTFIKRLKAASEVQRLLAAKVNSLISAAFGRSATELSEEVRQEPLALTQPLEQSAQNVERIQRDLEAYQREFPEAAREEVVADMKGLNVITKLQEMPIRLERNLRGDTLNRLEFWADTLDRWAEELAGPGKPSGGGGDDDNGKDRLPPALLLDILRIIYDEMDLREETRTLGQIAPEGDEARQDLSDRVTAQAVQQMYVQERTLNAISDIRAIPNGIKSFENELQKLNKAVQHMDDASAMLTEGTTGDLVVAAETAAIEALIEARRGGGGGGGSGDSGGGSTAGGSTNRSPLDMIGPAGDRSARVAPRQAGEGTGKTGRQLPEEYREGLDAFLNKIDQRRGK